MKSLIAAVLTIVDNYYLQNVIFTSGVGAEAGRVASSRPLARPGPEGCRGPRDKEIKGCGDSRYGNPGDPGTVVERTRSRPSADLTPGASGGPPAARVTDWNNA